MAPPVNLQGLQRHIEQVRLINFFLGLINLKTPKIPTHLKNSHFHKDLTNIKTFFHQGPLKTCCHLTTHCSKSRLHLRGRYSAGLRRR